MGNSLLLCNYQYLLDFICLNISIQIGLLNEIEHLSWLTCQITFTQNAEAYLNIMGKRSSYEKSTEKGLLALQLRRMCFSCSLSESNLARAAVVPSPLTAKSTVCAVFSIQFLNAQVRLPSISLIKCYNCAGFFCILTRLLDTRASHEKVQCLDKLQVIYMLLVYTGLRGKMSSFVQ